MLRRHSFTLAAAVCAAMLLSGCTAPATPASPSPSAEASPLFRTDAQALAAAKKAYAKYLDVGNRIGQAGWVDASGYKSVERGAALANEVGNAKSFASKGWKQSGAGTFDSLKIEQRQFSSGMDTVTVFLCVDASAVDVVDSSGASVVPADKPSRVPLEVTLDDRRDQGTLIVARSETWAGSNFC